MIATGVIVGVNYRPLAARYVTYRALEEARRLCEPGVADGDAAESIGLQIKMHRR